MTHKSYFARRYSALIGIPAADLRYALPASYCFTAQDLLSLRSIARSELHYRLMHHSPRFNRRINSLNLCLRMIDHCLNPAAQDFAHVARLAFALAL